MLGYDRKIVMRSLANRSTFSAWRRAMAGALVIVCACGSVPEPDPPFVTEPEAARLVTSDLEHFWAAYDAGGGSGSAAAFQAGYFDLASPGLSEFMGLRGLTAASLTAVVSAFPRYFAAIRANSLSLARDGAILATVREHYRRVKILYPPAVFAPVTFLIGRFATAGTTSPRGVMVGAEFFGIDDATPLGELGTFQRNNVRPPASLPIVVAHEHTHVLQAHGSAVFAHNAQTLLEQALLEGSADFVGELVSGGNLNARIFAFGLASEAALWAEFQTEMHGTDVSRWLYNQGTETPDRPGDLGYFIGYRITQAFYQRTPDHSAAVAAIVEVADADSFLARSGYAPSPPPASSTEHTAH